MSERASVSAPAIHRVYFGGGRRWGATRRVGRRAGGRGRRERDAPKRCFPLAFFPILYHPPAPCEGAVLARERVPPLIGRGFRESSASVVLGFIFSDWSFIYPLTVNFYFAQRANIISGELNSKKQRSNSGSEIFPGTFFWNSQKRRRASGGEATSVGGASGPPARAGVSTDSAICPARAGDARVPTVR